MYNLILAYAILAGAEYDVDCLLEETVLGMAIDLEILDSRERGHLGDGFPLVDENVKILQSRYKDLKNAPQVADSLRLPARKVIHAYIGVNRGYYAHVVAMMTPINSEEYDEIIKECDALYNFWDNVNDATNEYYYIYNRRLALKNIRDKMGEQDYYSSKWLPFVPLCRFQEIK